MTWESKSKSVVSECDQIVFRLLFLKFLLKNLLIKQYVLLWKDWKVQTHKNKHETT